MEDTLVTDAPPRESYLSVIDKLHRAEVNIAEIKSKHDEILASAIRTLNSWALEESKIDMEAHRISCDMFAAQAQHDISWKKALAGPDRDLAIAAYNKEMTSLQENILEEVTRDDEDWETALREATTGRMILAIK